jgi:membrane-bound serine protease (ClpP class)
MRVAGFIILFVALLAPIAWCQTSAPATFPANPPAAQTNQPSPAAIVVLSGTIDDFNKHALMEHFGEARKLGAKTIILQINTYGGLVTSGLDISRYLKQQNDLHIIAFVDDKAISAGAMIALACDEIVMEAGSTLGDCAPIAISESGGLETLGPAERAKMESPILEDFYDSAIRNGYDPLLVQSMVSVGRVVHWIENSDGVRKFVNNTDYEKLTTDGWKPVAGVRNPIDGENDLLTVGADLAKTLGLSRATVESPLALSGNRGLTILATLQPSAGAVLVGMLGSTAARGILTTVFLLSLYMAFSHPGHGAAEATAASTLALLVGIPLLTGYAQWWEILAILLGIVLLALEIFVVPGFGVTGISGLFLILVGLTMTWVGNEPIGIPGFLPSLPGTWMALKQGVIVIVTGLFASMALWLLLQRYLPRLPYFNRLILATVDSPADFPGAPRAPASRAGWPPVGSRGRAMTDLRPGGTAGFFDPNINDLQTVDVVCDSGFVPAGTELVVREVHGNRVVVRVS